MAVQLAPPRADPDTVAFEALNMIIGGNFVSRLNMNLREDKHWSYGANANLIEAKGQRPFLISAMVQTDRTVEALEEMLKELRELVGSRLPSESELQLAKNSLVLTLPGNNETSAEIANSYADILTYGLADNYLSDFSARVDALTSAQLRLAATRLIHPESLTWIVVGDLETLEARVRALGIGDVQVLDAAGNVLR